MTVKFLKNVNGKEVKGKTCDLVDSSYKGFDGDPMGGGVSFSTWKDVETGKKYDLTNVLETDVQVLKA